MPRCSRNPSDNWEENRYLNKNETEAERALQSAYWQEFINLYGTRVEWYVYNYSLTGHDYLYGEETTASYSGPYNINILMNINNEALLLSKFGLETNSDFLGLVSVADFQDVFGRGAEPKSVDVIRLIEAGWSEDELPPTSGDVLDQLCTMTNTASPATLFYTVSDKNYVRCPQLYEITERDWQDYSTSQNALLGHYVWAIKGKRFDYSYQPGIEPECKQDQVGEETFMGRLSGGANPESDPKLYDDNVTEDNRENIWDYDDGPQQRPDSVYGSY